VLNLDEHEVDIADGFDAMCRSARDVDRVAAEISRLTPSTVTVARPRTMNQCSDRRAWR
jgi:hypothetical protein